MNRAESLEKAFKAGKVIVGMAHLQALPGSARYGGDFEQILERAVSDARALEAGGAHAVMLENFFDAPFCRNRVPPVTVAAMTRAAIAVRDAVSIPFGLNVLRNDVVSALSIAAVTGAAFVRCNVYVGAAVTDQGLIEGAAREAVMARRALGAPVQIWADVAVKHASQLGGAPIGAQAREALERGLADAVIVSGPSTGAGVDMDQLRAVRSAVPEARVLIGSGLTVESAAGLLAHCDGAVVGTALKRDGSIASEVDPVRVARIVRAAKVAA